MDTTICTADGKCTTTVTDDNSIILTAPSDSAASSRSAGMLDLYTVGARVGTGEGRSYNVPLQCPATGTWTDWGRAIGSTLQTGGEIAQGVGIAVAFFHPPAGATIAGFGKAASIGGSGISALSNLVDEDYGAFTQDAASVVGGYGARKALAVSGATSCVVRNAGSQRFHDPKTGRFISNREGDRRNNQADAQGFAVQAGVSYSMPRCQ